MELDYAERLGAGAWGEVWRAKDKLGRDLAVKFLHHPESYVERQALEHARALVRVRHENVQKVVAVEEQEHPTKTASQLAIIFEYAEGSPLSQTKSIGAARVERLGLDIIDGIRAIHAAGLVHGDMHDGNVIVGERAIVIDPLYTHSLAEVGTKTARATVAEDEHALVRLLHLLVTKSTPSQPITAGLHSLLIAPPPLESIRHQWEAAFRNRPIYSLIVTADTDAWNHHAFKLRRDRFLQSKYTSNNLRERFGPLSEAAISELLEIPALFAVEKRHRVPARRGRVTNISPSDPLFIEFEIDSAAPAIELATLREESALFRLIPDDWELNETHWAMKDVSLDDVLKKLGK